MLWNALAPCGDRHGCLLATSLSASARLFAFDVRSRGREYFALRGPAGSHTNVVAAAVLVMTLVGLAGCSRAADSTHVSVTVNADGRSCVVDHRDAPCSSLAIVLTQDLGIAKSAELTVSPERCGGSAMARAHEVADELKRAGFTRIAVVGFLTEPSSNCGA